MEELKQNVCNVLHRTEDERTDCIGRIEAEFVKVNEASDDSFCAQDPEWRRLQYDGNGNYIIRAYAPTGVDLPKGICDLMDNCRSGTVSSKGVFTANPGPMNQEEADGSSGLDGVKMTLVLLGSICGLCILAIIAYLVYLAYRSQQRQCASQEARCRRPVCRVDPNARCVRINVPLCEQV